MIKHEMKHVVHKNKLLENHEFLSTAVIFHSQVYEMDKNISGSSFEIENDKNFCLLHFLTKLFGGSIISHFERE